MIALLSPAKSLDYDTPAPLSRSTQPRFKKQTAELVSTLRGYSASQLGTLLKLSEKLADLNYQRYQDHEPDYTKDNAKQALTAFTGDVYQGFTLPEWDTEDYGVAQDQVRILSGLYGLLRPLDLIQPYRLEMGTKLPTDAGTNLYHYWGDRLTKQLEKDAEKSEAGAIVNLASKEYSSSLQLKDLSAPVITPVFKDEKNGTFKIISFYAKKARGLMADYIVRHRLTDPEALKDFDSSGYQYIPSESDESTLVFHRPE